MERKIKIEDKELVKILKHKERLNDDIIAWNKKAEDCERERNKIAIKHQKVKESVQTIISEKIAKDLTDIEYIASVKLDNGIPTATIIDAVEEFKITYLERRNAGKNAQK